MSYPLFARAMQDILGSPVVDEHRFHTTRKWRFDLACPSRRIAVEIEGGAWSRGRHTRGVGYIGDMEKYNCAILLGWRVFRYTPNQLDRLIDDMDTVQRSGI